MRESRKNENHWIPKDNNENHENHRIPYEHKENHENVKTQCEN